jgi:hypothetical protein
MPPIGTIAAVGLVKRRHAIEMLVDGMPHLAAQNAGKRIPAESPVALAHSNPCACMPFTSSNAVAKLAIVTACGIGGAPFVDLSNPPSTPSHRPDINRRTSPFAPIPLKNGRAIGYINVIFANLDRWGQSMLGERKVQQDASFYEFSLERHVPEEHLLRAIDGFVELDGLRRGLEPLPAANGSFSSMSTTGRANRGRPKSTLLSRSERLRLMAGKGRGTTDASRWPDIRLSHPVPLTTISAAAVWNFSGSCVTEN